MTLSEKLQNLRRAAGLSQEQLAERLGVTRQAVSKWETGEGKPDIDNLLPLARLLHTTVDYLLGCDAARQQKEIEAFKTQAQALVNKGKRRESLELCRQYQKKYPHNETVLNHLMHDLYIVDRTQNWLHVFYLCITDP